LLIVKRSLRPVGWRKVLPALPAVAAALLPKCPACLPAYAALASSLGLGFLTESAYLLPLIILVLVLAVLGHTLRKDDHPRYAPIVLEVFGVSVLRAGKFLLYSRPIAVGGGACLIAGSLWSLWPQSHVTCDACPGNLPAKSVTRSHG